MTFVLVENPQGSTIGQLISVAPARKVVSAFRPQTGPSFWAAEIQGSTFCVEQFAVRDGETGRVFTECGQSPLSDPGVIARRRVASGAYRAKMIVARAGPSTRRSSGLGGRAVENLTSRNAACF
jgi:hypothetical protein